MTWWLSVTILACLKFCDILRILWQNVTKWSVKFCDKQEFLWHFKTCLHCLFFVNKSTIIYKKILIWEHCQVFNNGKYIAKYSIMVSTLGVVGEHFSVAQRIGIVILPRTLMMIMMMRKKTLPRVTKWWSMKELMCTGVKLERWQDPQEKESTQPSWNWQELLSPLTMAMQM